MPNLPKQEANPWKSNHTGGEIQKKAESPNAASTRRHIPPYFPTSTFHINQLLHSASATALYPRHVTALANQVRARSVKSAHSYGHANSRVLLSTQSPGLVVHLVPEPAQIDPLHRLASVQVGHHQVHHRRLVNPVAGPLLLLRAWVHRQADDRSLKQPDTFSYLPTFTISFSLLPRVSSFRLPVVPCSTSFQGC